MKKLALLTAVFIMGLTCMTPDMMSRGRQNTGNNTSTNTQRPGSPANPGNASQRPGTPNVKPGNVGNNNGGNFNPGNKPGAPMPPGNKPGAPTPPPPKPAPVPPPPKPSYGYNPGYNYRPPMPATPPSYIYSRPTPPPSWRPSSASFSFGRILGITLGSLISNSINSLFNNGYTVTGYTNNNIYLRDVNYCNVTWPEATMYYNNGYLRGSLFSASSYTYDPTRYNYVYSYLTTHYGMPVSSQTLSNGGMSSTWWGSNNTYLTLSFYPETSVYGGTRFYTTLSTGY